MKKDIEIPIAKDVYVAIIHEWTDDFLSKNWNAYIINGKTVQIDMVLVTSKGYDGNRKTSVMRHGIGVVGPKSYEKIELLQEDVLALKNEFFVTFYAEGTLYEKRYFFEKNAVNTSNLVNIPIIEKEGVLAE